MDVTKQCEKCRAELPVAAEDALCPQCRLERDMESKLSHQLNPSQQEPKSESGATPVSLGEFELGETLGEGAMGRVYKARHRSSGQIVALKVLSPRLGVDPVYLARFQQEAAAAARLNHPNIVQMIESGEVEDVHYIAMEMIRGESLLGRLERQGRLAPAEALAACYYVAEALAHAWQQTKLVHRDIKPSNVFVSNEAEVKLGDFGLAKHMDGSSAQLTQSGVTMGTPHYMSPEQANGEAQIDFRSDIYSLGCTLYHLLTGKPPYEGSNVLAVMNKHIHDPAPEIFKAMPDCPAPLGTMVGKMLAKKPEQRHQSHEELLAEMRWVYDQITGSGSMTVSAPPSAKAARGLRSSVWIYASAAGASTLIVSLLLWTLLKPKPAQDRPATTSQAHTPSRAAKAEKIPGGVMITSTGIELVYIPPGEFLMGSTREERAWASERLGEPEGKRKGKREQSDNEGEQPRRTRVPAGFWLGRTELTAGQWRQFVNETRYVTDAETQGDAQAFDGEKGAVGKVKGASWRDPKYNFPMRDDHPVVCVNWSDAQRFCEWLTNKEKRAGCLPSGCAFRLPTEAEWEYACRGGREGTRFWWGDSEDDARGRLNAASQDAVGAAQSPWEKPFPWSDGFGLAAPVDSCGSKGRNGFGLADMLGNVAEWCLDCYDTQAAHAEHYVTNTQQRVFRGGSFQSAPGRVRCATRFSSGLMTRGFSRGFRLCCGPEPARAPTATATPEKPPPPPATVAAITASSVGMELVRIPPGEFPMGSTWAEQAWARENAGGPGKGKDKSEQFMNEGKEPRRVRIKNEFWLGRTEVTVGQWRRFTDAARYVTEAETNGEANAWDWDLQKWGAVKGANWRDPKFRFEPRDDHPVTCVSWFDAVKFCEWLTKQETSLHLPKGYVFRLPTEAEWEHACRGGRESTKFWWGDSEDDGRGRLNAAGEDEKPEGKGGRRRRFSWSDGFPWVAPVDSFGERGRNGFGLADMLGNVAEWCLDNFDPQGAHETVYVSESAGHVVRGGGFDSTPGAARCAVRQSPLLKQATTSRRGFRVCCGLAVIKDEASASSTARAKTAALPAAMEPSPQAAAHVAQETAARKRVPPPQDSRPTVARASASSAQPRASASVGTRPAASGALAHSAYVRVQRMSNSKIANTLWSTSWGSHETDYSRMMGIDIEVRNMQQHPDTFSVEWYFVAKTVARGEFWLFDSGKKSVELKAGAVEQFSQVCKPIKQTVEHYESLGVTYLSGSKLEGYVVVVRAEGQIIASAVSLQYLEPYAKNPDLLPRPKIQKRSKNSK